MTNHPLLRELRDALLGIGDVAWVRAHLAECLACRVRMARIAQADALESPTPNVVQRIVDASTVVPGATDIPIGRDEREPEPGELWRIGRDEALLAWVRKNFYDGAVDIVPVVLDIELSDEQTLIVEADLSPLPVELGAMVALRTHVHRDAFINRLGTLDIAAEIEDVITATRKGRDTAAPVGPPIELDDDDRIEYRQALRDLLDELSPSNWPAETASADGAATGASSQPQFPGPNLTELQTQIQYRIRAAQCIALPSDQFDLEHGRSLRPLFKVAYLNTAVVVTAVEALGDALVDEPALVRACQRAMESSPDADAVCVAEPQEEWVCVLYSCASMREALELPRGKLVGPAPILTGYGVVDTLSKHLEGAAPAWEVTDSAPRGFGSIDMTEIAARHAQTSIAGIQALGRRAHQQPKKATWSTLSPELEERVSRFITSVIDSVPVADALTELTRENPRD
jgi:hypothetical protein